MLFKFSRQFNFAHFGSEISIFGPKVKSTHKSNVIFKISDSRYSFSVFCLIRIFPFKIPTLVIRSRPSCEEAIFLPGMKLDLVTRISVLILYRSDFAIKKKRGERLIFETFSMRSTSRNNKGSWLKIVHFVIDA